MGPVDAVPKEWKDILRSDSYEKDPSTILGCSNIIVFMNQKPVVSVKTLTSKVIYAEFISRIYKKSQQHSKILNVTIRCKSGD